jgi:hypothetical protein
VGVRVPEINEVSFRLADVSWWNYPAWVPAGIEVLQHVISLDIKIKIKNLQVEALNAARKKTTQKVNLYEKVQIPAYEEAILKIKRFLEDKENISKAAQKIVKKRYYLDEVLGKGVQGIVFAAFDKKTQKKVAVKIKDTKYDDKEQVMQEIKVLEQLTTHFPNRGFPELIDY